MPLGRLQWSRAHGRALPAMWNPSGLALYPMTPYYEDESVRLFTELGIADGVKYARHHHDVVARFGRFPHRNAFLGRDSTPEEAELLKQPGSSF